jgi:hypothetical protein
MQKVWETKKLKCFPTYKSNKYVKRGTDNTHLCMILMLLMYQVDLKNIKIEEKRVETKIRLELLGRIVVIGIKH